MLFPLSYRCQELSMIIKVIINLFIRLLYKFIYRFSWPPKLDIECHEKGSRIDPGYRISTPMTFSYSNLTKSVEPCIVVDLSFGASGLYIAPWCFYKEHFHVTSLPPCWRAKAIHLFSCKIVSLFRPSNMSAMKTLHWQLGYGRAILASLNWTKSVDYSEVVTVSCRYTIQTTSLLWQTVYNLLNFHSLLEKFFLFPGLGMPLFISLQCY